MAAISERAKDRSRKKEDEECGVVVINTDIEWRGKQEEKKRKIKWQEERRGEGQKGKLVHAMIMVMNHKSHNIAEENQNGKTKEK